jgi:integral membrane protein
MNFRFSNTAIGRFRAIGITEGISYLLLLLIGMPLKYMAGIPEVVKIMGWMHGILFILYVVALIQVSIPNRWSFIRVLIALIASLLPFGTFLLDKRLRAEETIQHQNTNANE